jgi:hypothetical protein
MELAHGNLVVYRVAQFRVETEWLWSAPPGGTTAVQLIHLSFCMGGPRAARNKAQRTWSRPE